MSNYYLSRDDETGEYQLRKIKDDKVIATYGKDEKDTARHVTQMMNNVPIAYPVTA